MTRRGKVTWLLASACSVPAVNEQGEKPKPLRKDGRVWNVAIVALLVGILIGTAVVRKVWNLPPNWGDIPTWLAVAGAAAAAWIALQQLSDLRGQVADESERNRKRDLLVDKQLAEAERRAKSERRQLVEGVELIFPGQAGYVENNSKRPINEVTCKIMSRVDRVSLVAAVGSGEVVDDGVGIGRAFIEEPKPVPSFETLPPGAACGFTFGNLTESSDQVLVAWFTDDDGFRWQLDQPGKPRRRPRQRTVQARSARTASWPPASGRLLLSRPR